MDSSSVFAPVCKGFMMFHFCKKTGCFGNVSFLRENIFSVWFRAKDARVAKGQRLGKKRTAKYAKYANKKPSRNNLIQPQMDADSERPGAKSVEQPPSPRPSPPRRGRSIVNRDVFTVGGVFANMVTLPAKRTKYVVFERVALGLQSPPAC